MKELVKSLRRVKQMLEFSIAAGIGIAVALIIKEVIDEKENKR